MSVVNPEPRAAPAPGAAFAYHRTSRLVEWLRRGNGFRLALSAVAGLCGVLLHDWSGGLIFPFTPAISLTAGLLFGWLGSPAPSPASSRRSGSPTAASRRRSDLLALLRPHRHRRLDDLPLRPQARARPAESAVLPLDPGRRPRRAALSGAALTLASSGRPRRGRSAALWVWAWGTGALVSVVLLAPPILLLFDRYGRRWMVPIPGEFRGEDRRGRAGSSAPARRR